MKSFILILAVLVCSGCSTIRKWVVPEAIRHIAESPSIKVDSKGAVEIKGDSQVQPKVDTKQDDATILLPEGSTFDFNEKLGTIRLTMAKPSEMVLKRTQTAIEGPRSFTPDKGPTIGEEKKAEADFWTSLGLKAGLAIGSAIALFGLVRGWDFVMYGGGALAGACAFGIFVERHPVLLGIIGLGVALAIVGPIIYHTKLKKLTSETNAGNANQP